MNLVKAKYCSKEQGFRLIEEFQASGLKIKVFCEQKNINLRVFYYWMGKHERELYKKPKGSFIPLKLNAYTPLIGSLKISLASMMVELPLDINMTMFRQVLEICQDVVNR